MKLRHFFGKMNVGEKIRVINSAGLIYEKKIGLEGYIVESPYPNYYLVSRINNRNDIDIGIMSSDIYTLWEPID